MNKDRNKHGVYIPADLWEQLRAFCEKHYNVSCSAVICRAVKELIEREEAEREFFDNCCIPPIREEKNINAIDEVCNDD